MTTVISTDVISTDVISADSTTGIMEADAGAVSTGRVVYGSCNMFTVKTESLPPEIHECRIKGKILKTARGFYNPLAPGDLVEFDAARGLILSLRERRSVYTRFNIKGNAPQLLAANVDAVVCLATPVSPPFRPRFLDRLLLQADAAEIPALVVCNKVDLFPALDGETLVAVEKRLSDFERLGYPVLRVSVKTGEGMKSLEARLKGRRAVLVGQSGCGKTSLVNALLPAAMQKTGALNKKYDRGNHTTVMSVLFDDGEAGFSLIDTPGIRRLVPDGIAPGDLQTLMRDFAPFAGKCAFGLSCTHGTEPGCRIREAVETGKIHEDRFESYIRISDELSRRN
ncbi:MAG: ribosome small subunit-dependent GTPase A [Spirochaetaceae bacterium]|jgi:ribosome biogenesis GTPase|nr:ribosome small subunit-dependent GTPase A [Spirochaetaceae bacterium]